MRTITIGRIKTSRTELFDITKAWLIVSLAFAVVFSSLSLLSGGFSFDRLFSTNFLFVFAVALVTAGLGFLLHELAHKFVAQHYGCTAEFRSDDMMLYLALGLAVIVGFIFAAPGAVMIVGMVTRRENGIISWAGPLTNYILAMVFLVLMILIAPLKPIFSIGFQVNMWLGLFNMIPFGMFDGLKILHWNRWVWGAMVVFGIAFVFFSGRLLNLFI